MSMKLVNGAMVVSDDEPPIVPDMEVDDFPTEEPVSDDIRRCQFESCEQSLTYAGRGAPPKYCDIHKRSKSNTISPDRSAGNATTGKSFPGEGALRTSLVNRYYALSNVVMFATRNPAYVQLIVAQAGECADAHIELARSNPTYRKWLQAGVEKTAAAGLVAAHAKMFGPIIMGETLKRKMATPPLRSVPNEGNSRNTSGPFMSRPNRPNPAPEPTRLYDPTEDPPDPRGESVNAGNLPGMPGF
jgi:hypothetical protein